MQVLQIDGGFGLDHLTLAERPDPSPGPGQVAVRMKAISLNFRDLLTVTGLYGGQPQLPLVPFSDGAGVVEAVGEGVSRVKVGDRVTSLFFSDTWLAGGPTVERLSGSLGGPHDGCGQELMVLSENGVSTFPDHLSFEEAACLPCAALTAWRALIVDAQSKGGDTVVIQGTGGVSIFALQFAHKLGLTTIVTSSSDEKLEKARALGADVLINYKTTPEWAGEVRKATGGRGADLVVEVGGAQTLNESLKAVRIGGHVAIIGVLSGPAETMPIPMLIWTNARVQGLSVGSRESYEDMCRFMTQTGIKPIIDTTYPWTDAAKALGAMQGQSHFGKIVLTF